MRPLLSAASLAAAMLSPAFAAPLAAQCTNPWLAASSAMPSPMLFAVVGWDPDGAGPQPAGLVVGGNFSTIGGASIADVAFYDPASDAWSALPGLPPDAEVRALAVLADGTLVAGGTFGGPNGLVNLAQWNGATWAPVGGGVDNTVFSLLAMPDGDLIVGGSFVTAGGVSAPAVARWDGVGWSALSGLSGIAFPGLFVLGLTSTANGDIYAGGSFVVPGGNGLARWNGSSWTAIGPVGDFVLSLMTTRDDEVMVGRQSGVYRVVGTGLQPFAGYGDVNCMWQLPDGDLLVAGINNELGQGYQSVARASAGSWQVLGRPVGTGFGIAPVPGGSPSGGDLVVVGVTSATAGSMARLSTTCPASVVSYGAGCVGSGGANQLAANSAPWIGSTFRARATGMPASALVLSVYGFTPVSIPFASVIPEGLPGCSILMTGDLIDVLLPNGGVVDTAVRLPDAAALVGGVFHHYVVPFEVDALLQVTAVSSSNALTCTVGAF